MTTAFAKNVRRARLLLGMSQYGLAEKMGVHLNTIGLYERGQSTPLQKNLIRLAAALRTTAWALVYEDPELEEVEGD